MQKVEIIFLPFATNRSPRYLLFSKITLVLIVLSAFCALSVGAFIFLNQAIAFYHHWQLKSIHSDNASLITRLNSVKLNLKKLDLSIKQEEDFLEEVSLVTETSPDDPNTLSADNFVITRRFSLWEEKSGDLSQLHQHVNASNEKAVTITGKDLQAIFFAIDELESKVKRNQQFADKCYQDMSEKYEAWAHTPSILPLDGAITSRYGVIRPHLGGPRKGPHRGVDIAGPLGIPLRACAAGRVLFAGWSSGYGYLVIIDHLNGYYSYYGHCMVLKVKENQMVKRYQEIALLGSTGRSTGPHVHFEIREDDIHNNPMHFIEENDE
ncbi:M23 family metallopeptidase [candidate division KSB1 bacterium]|nr:M23 family metallopeptidase [candidate division KSB1 bacterium]